MRENNEKHKQKKKIFFFCLADFSLLYFDIKSNL